MNKETLKTSFLGLATFFNPLGFDIIVLKLQELTGGYWTTMFILYFLSGLLFILSAVCFKTDARKVGNLLLMASLFFLPFGYDFIVYGLNTFIGDYTVTNMVMYGFALFFFLCFLYMSGGTYVKDAFCRTRRWKRSETPTEPATRLQTQNFNDMNYEKQLTIERLERVIDSVSSPEQLNSAKAVIDNFRMIFEDEIAYGKLFDRYNSKWQDLMEGIF